MNRHFTDSFYYAKRTVVSFKNGVLAELEPVRERVRRFRGEEEEGRFEHAKQRAAETAEQAKEEATTKVEAGRERVAGYRA